MLIEFFLNKNPSEYGERHAITWVIHEASHYLDRLNTTFLTQAPVFFNGEKDVSNHSPIDLSRIQNEVSGVFVTNEGDEKKIVLFSAKLSRSRLFYVFKGQSLFVSDDLRKLLPYSSRTLRNEVAYGILKFGETPEYYTVIQDIYCVPCGEYIQLDASTLDGCIKSRMISLESFSRYFTISYPGQGGNIVDTEQCLKNILEAIKPYNPTLLVSGGIDSTLLSFLYNEVNDSPYPAIFLDFKEAPEELEFAKKSIKNTKADFMPIRLDSDHILNDFMGSVENLIYPVYDNGSALVGYKLRKHFAQSNDLSKLSFVDGTLADSCYGVRNYSQKLQQGGKQLQIVTSFKEWVYLKSLIKNIRWNRTKPRDSYLDDEFLQDLLWNGGPFVNFWFENAKEHTLFLKNEYQRYFNVLAERNRGEYWPQYTILKMMLYAAKQTTVKVHDMLLPAQTYFPFMFKSILIDQGKYTWEQKSENNTIKAPLKKILEKYIGNDFIYRKKVGLQSQTRAWLLDPSIKPFVLELISRNDGLTKQMMGKEHKQLVNTFSKETPPVSLTSLVLALSVTQMWCDINNVSIK